MDIEDDNILNLDELSLEEKSKLFKVWKTLNKMMEDRGYSKNDNSNLKYDEFIAKLNIDKKMYGIFAKVDPADPDNIIRTYYEYIPNPKIGSLKFVYYIQAISDHNPRKKAAYIFRFGFDYANYGYTSSSLPVFSGGSLLHIYFPRDYHLYTNENPAETIITYKYIDNQQNQFTKNARILGKLNKIMVTGRYKYKMPMPLHIIKRRRNKSKETKTEPTDIKLLFY